MISNDFSDESDDENVTGDDSLEGDSSTDECSDNETADIDYEPEEKKPRSIIDPYPGTNKKLEILNYWILSDNKRRSFTSMKSKYTKLSSDRQLRKWRTQFAANSEFFMQLL